MISCLLWQLVRLIGSLFQRIKWSFSCLENFALNFGRGSNLVTITDFSSFIIIMVMGLLLCKYKVSFCIFRYISRMDIKFHVSKIIDSGSNVNDWVSFIDQVKNKCDRDILAQIYTVALNNIAEKRTKEYKKLLIGLGNLQR